MLVPCTFVEGCNWSNIEAILLILTNLPCICVQAAVGTNPSHFHSSTLAIWPVLFGEAFECCSSLSQTNMTTDVLGSGPFQQPFNKTSSAVRHTGSLMLRGPAENTLPPVSKPSAFGSPGEPALSCRVYLNLLGRSCLFPYSRLRDI